jgi:thymidine phosphorylase
LARALVSVGKGAGKRVSALITDMSAPIGRTVGNALETREALEILQNTGPADTRALTLELGAEMLLVAKRCKTKPQALELLQRALADGSALAVFRRLVKAQGGDVRCVDDPSRLPRARAQLVVKAGRSGYVRAIDSFALGNLAIELGAGRTRADQKIDPAAGFELEAVVGSRVAKGQALVTIHATRPALARSVAGRVQAAFTVGARPPKRNRLVLGRVG